MINVTVNRDSFVKYFLDPIKKINVEGTCSLYGKGTSLYSLATSSDKTCSIYAIHEVGDSLTADFETIYISDVKRLILALKWCPYESIDLCIDEEKLYHSGKKYQFSTYLLDPKFAARTTLNPDKIAKLETDLTFTVGKDAMRDIRVGRMVAPDATKLYFYEQDEGIYVNLNDKTKSKIDNASVMVSEAYNGTQLKSPFIITGDLFKYISQFSNDIVFRMNTKIGILLIESFGEDFKLQYVTSALVK